MPMTHCVPCDRLEPQGSVKGLSTEQPDRLADQLTNRLDRFFADIEKRAYHMANYALGNPDDALDAVQEAMIGLVERYSNRPAEEWRPLFYTILHSRIRDRQRRSSVRKRFGGFLSLLNRDADQDADPFQEVQDHAAQDPEQSMSNEDTGAAIEQALKKLPWRQQQTFLLRIWEGCSVKQTAKVLGCSEGSVKTHLSRAMTTLREELGAFHYVE